MIEVNISFTNESDKAILLDLIKSITDQMTAYSYSKSKWFCKYYWKRVLFAAPYQMRWSLINKFHARHYEIEVGQELIQTHKSVPNDTQQGQTIGATSSKQRRWWSLLPPAKIDAYLLPCVFSNDNAWEEEAIVRCPTVILCFPNGAFIEYFYFQCEWVNFYLEKGINVFLWNYRGYYRSSGVPTSKNILQDAKRVYDFLKLKVGIKGNIGVHGESLGGYVASYLAKQCKVDFLLVDRSFWCFDKLVQAKYGYFSQKCFKCISGYNVHSDTNYIEAKCFKVVAQDTFDVVIDSVSGLKNGITLNMLKVSDNQNHLQIKDAEEFLDVYDFLNQSLKNLSKLQEPQDLMTESRIKKDLRNVNMDKYVKKRSDAVQKIQPVKKLTISDKIMTKASSHGTKITPMVRPSSKIDKIYENEIKSKSIDSDIWNVITPFVRSNFILSAAQVLKWKLIRKSKTPSTREVFRGKASAGCLNYRLRWPRWWQWYWLRAQEINIHRYWRC